VIGLGNDRLADLLNDTFFICVFWGLVLSQANPEGVA
jgi:hypothetical protein